MKRTGVCQFAIPHPYSNYMTQSRCCAFLYQPCACSTVKRPKTSSLRHPHRLLRCPSSSGLLQEYRSRFLTRVVPRAKDEDGEERELDIEALARRLSREAERLRRSESGNEASSSYIHPRNSDREDPIFGSEALQRQNSFLACADGGFDATDFEILQQLGKLSWVTENAKENPLQVASNSSEKVQAIIAFAAKYYSGGPFQDPVTVLLKEFLPAAKPVGCNELEVSTRLSGLPDMKWQAAVAGLSPDLPVIPILGHFMAGQSSTGVTLSQDSVEDPEELHQALWLVYKWENLQPLTFYPAAEQPRGRSGMQLWPSADTEAQILTARCQMLRRIARGIISALAFCHEKGIAHGSLGSGSVLLNTFEDKKAANLIVKLTNFGFAQLWEPPESQSLADSLDWQKEDLQAAGIIILETIFSALAEGGPSPITTAEALKRQLLEVFSCDVDQTRQYLSQEPELTAPAALLDQLGASGWALVAALVTGKARAADLLSTNAFLQP